MAFLRISVFGFLSTFGFRVSDFGASADRSRISKNCRLEYRNFRVNFVFN